MNKDEMTNEYEEILNIDTAVCYLLAVGLDVAKDGKGWYYVGKRGTDLREAKNTVMICNDERLIYFANGYHYCCWNKESK